jgi:hypothetical protein
MQAQSGTPVIASDRNAGRYAEREAGKSGHEFGRSLTASFGD